MEKHINYPVFMVNKSTLRKQISKMYIYEYLVSLTFQFPIYFKKESDKLLQENINEHNISLT